MNSKLLRREVVSEKTFLLTSNKNFAVWMLSQFSSKILIWKWHFILFPFVKKKKIAS